MSIKLHIERLVLNDIPVSQSDSPLLQTVIETELARLLSGNGVNPKFQMGDTLSPIKAGDIRFTARNSPGDLGKQIAGAVHRGIGK